MFTLNSTCSYKYDNPILQICTKFNVMYIVLLHIKKHAQVGYG